MNTEIELSIIHSFDRQSWWPTPEYTPDANCSRQGKEDYER